MFRLLFLIVFVFVKTNANECAQRSYGTDQTVCVCNATYCDYLSKSQLEEPNGRSVHWYVSNKEGLRMSLKTVYFGTQEESSNNITIVINSSKKYQQIFGFGGAITDTVGVVMQKLSARTQQQLLESYFGSSGIGFTYVRVPIAGSDFSTRPYTYDDYDYDVSLQHFALAEEDYKYKIPIIKEAMKLEPTLQVITSAWTAPAWMKTVDSINGNFGLLQPRYYQTYANYLMKFFDAYKKNGIKVAAISTGNEPLSTFLPLLTLNKMGWTPDTMATWITENLGPTLSRSGYNDTMILAFDDQTPLAQKFMEEVFSNEKARQYVSGIATHWYDDKFITDASFAKLHPTFSDKFLMMTEACIGSEETDKVVIGAWDRGEAFIQSMLRYLNNWFVAWFEWNIAVDTVGGPTWTGNYVDSSILVNTEADEFYKQPMFYALAHVSKFVVRDSFRISMDIMAEDDPIHGSAFVTPSDEIVVVLYNRDFVSHKVVLKDVKKGTLTIKLYPNSINTLLYKL